MKDSIKTQKLFDRSCEEIEAILDNGKVLDKGLTEVILKAFLGHIKIRNLEVREDALKFVVNRHIAENIKQMKDMLRKTLPEYVAK